MGENRVKIWVLIPVAVCLLRALSPTPKIDNYRKMVVDFTYY